jgi:hypothetical protein
VREETKSRGCTRGEGERARLEGMGLTSTREKVDGVDGGGRGPGLRREGWGCRRGRRSRGEPRAWRGLLCQRDPPSKSCVCAA